MKNEITHDKVLNNYLLNGSSSYIIISLIDELHIWYENSVIVAAAWNK